MDNYTTAKLMKFLKEAANSLKSECEDRRDACSYAMDIAIEANEELKLGYEEGSDSMGVLHKKAYDAIWASYS